MEKNSPEEGDEQRWQDAMLSRKHSGSRAIAGKNTVLNKEEKKEQ